ncbi:U-scoloptoxin(05)-Cw1a-like [Penaeus japonicus]|uniref:U-scoloptoxin(05)-Cw1a-like n=1 Tax=Penaeus japonicus TaxID=27405 RepID=UPI001C717B39|nr:U-scoloptoxin(05)-Cw1a-like [Penaeus japonicus]
MKFAAAILVLTLVAVHSGEAIKCYECLNSNDCQKEVECAGSCTKTTTTTAGVAANARACSPVKLENGCKESTVAGIKSNLCACDSDLCNAGVVTHVAIPLMIVAVLLGRLM